MGILHRLVFILAKLDPNNVRWKEQQIAPIRRAIADSKSIPDSRVRAGVIAELEQKIDEIEEAFGRNELDYGRKLYLIENCIYGVDIQPIAVQIAKLRFFISLIVDQRIDDRAPNRGVLPLPNLETKFVAANTLIGIEKPAQMALRNPAIDEKERELAEVRSKHFRARTPRTKEKWREADKRLRAEIGELLRQDGFPNETTVQLAHWDPYDQNASAGFFDPEWMFGLDDGFHVVIGNPPYVRQEKIKHLKPVLQKQYTCYTGTADLYVYFIERGVNLLKDAGVLCYICSNKYFRAAYGKKLRSFLAHKTKIHQLIDFGDAPVFTAIAYPSILVTQKMAPGDQRLAAFTWEPGPPVADFVPIFQANKFRMPQKALTADGWRLEQREVRALLEKLRQAGRPLGEYVGGRFYRGILTGLNEAFVVDRATRDRLIAEHPSSAEVLKPYLRGQDIKRWYVDYDDLYVIFTRRGVNIDKYPAIKRHLLQYKEQLEPRPSNWDGPWPGRKAGSYKWFEIQDNIAYWQEFQKPKILYQEIATFQAFAWDQDGYFSNNKTFLIPDSSLFLLAILNSKVTWFFLDKLASKLQGGAYAMQTPYVGQIPIPAVPERRPIESRVKQILSAKKLDPQADVSNLENEVEEIVFALFGLSPAEIALVIEDESQFPEAPQFETPHRNKRMVDGNYIAAGESINAPPLFFTGRPPEGTFRERRARLETLTKQAGPAAIQELVAALTDETETIRWQAGTALRRIGGPQVAGVLQAFIAQTDNPAAKAEAEKVLRNIV